MATEKKTTRKLTGIAKERFFDIVPPEEAKKIVTSLRVRNDAYPVSRALQKTRVSKPVARKPARKTVKEPAAAAPEPAAPTPAASPPPPAASAPPEPSAETSDGFDAFQFGLVPVFKREGADGLREKLNSVETTDQLREMAKAQQIILPRDIRRGEVDAETVRTAILEAVEQRVTDRKAQL